MVDLSRVRVGGPLEPFAAGFAVELLRQGYALQPAAQQLRLLAHLSRWMAAESFGAEGLSEAVVEDFMAARRAAGYRNLVTARSLRALLTYLRGAGVTPSAVAVAVEEPVDVALERYRRYLVVERGVASETVRAYLRSVRPFLMSRLSSDGQRLDLGGLSAADVIAFVVARCPAQSGGAAKQTTTALRSLLRYLHVEGEIDRPLAGAVPSVAGWRLAGLPQGLEPDQIKRLLDSCDRETATGRRDFAIVTTLVRLGLRAGEVAALMLDDVDWRGGAIVVRGKGSRLERLPLPADVGKATAAYLRDGRPTGALDRTVFVRVKAPHRSMTSSGVTSVVAAAGRRAGLGSIRAHRLRHTVATQILRAGGSLPEVGQLLRHRQTVTTAIYAKVDREALREIARPWPGVSA
ncbi:MAG: site-specific integrase [Solirubrobacteraceae bacterium]